MAKSKERSFEPLCVEVAGVQSASDRFGHQRGVVIEGDEAPPTSAWRCNLTALSHTHNLYVVACVDCLYIYEPRFPSQALSKTPALVVPFPPSRPNLRGHIDIFNPHAINNLVVQFLGSDEVIATVHDDGDVNAILVRHVAQAISRRAEPDNSLGPQADEVRPIFQSNVGKSAWGLAIHSQARTIAVSCNTPDVTIFQFGLVESDEQPADDSHQRSTDFTQTIVNGVSNIPCIAFCNTGDDPSARWLLTTDIEGYCRTIDLHDLVTAQIFRFGRPMMHSLPYAMDPVNPGWIVAFLDRRSFYPETSFHAALGLDEDEKLPGGPDNLAIWDIGATVDHVPDRSDRFSSRLSRRRRPGSTHPLTSPPSTNSPSTSNPTSPSPNRPSTLNHAPSPSNPPSDSSSSSDISTTTYHPALDLDVSDTSDAEPFPSHTPFAQTRRILNNAPHFYLPTRPCADLPCPILHASLRNVYLLQPSAHLPITRDPRHPYPNHFTTPAPTIGFANALHQSLSGTDLHLHVFERMNMLLSIPALGILVLASQKGRVLLLALTKLPRNRTHPASFPSTHRSFAASSSSSSSSSSAQDPSLYTLRIEHILPFAHQEARGHRPSQPLLGIAAAPVQGEMHLPPARQTRWRLMLTYADHAVLAYELRGRPWRGKRGGAGVGAGEGVEEVVVV